jgi:cytochrome c556
MKTKLLLGLGLLAFSFATAHAAEALDEKQFQKLMKQVGKVSKDFKTNFEGKNGAALERDAATAAAAYRQMAGFWKTRKADDAAKWSEDSAAAATAMATAAKAGNWDNVKTHWNAVSRNCKGCHDTYREKLPDGGYKIK